jgi:hypothetical protein
MQRNWNPAADGVRDHDGDEFDEARGIMACWSRC